MFGLFLFPPAGFLLRKAVTIFIIGRTLKPNQDISINFKSLTNLNVYINLEIDGYFLDEGFLEFTHRELIFKQNPSSNPTDLH